MRIDLFKMSLGVAAALLAAGAAPAQPPLDFSVKHPDSGPTRGLPPGSSQISYFGERAAFSPDGRKIAFVGDYDAFEYDRSTGLTRNLTAHIAHKTILRVQYLADGNFIISGFRSLGKLQFATRDETRKVRATDTDLFFLGKRPGAPLLPLDAQLHEGFALSRTANKIAWAENVPHDMTQTVDGHAWANMYVADVRVAPDGLHASLANRKLVKAMDIADCYWEPQDFRNGDSEILAPCYMTNRTALRGDKGAPALLGEKIVGVNVATGKVVTYYTKTDMYAEIEGTAPDGKWALIECGPRLAGPLDLCRFDFAKGPDQILSRVTFGQDYGPYKISNPVVSRDGKWAAAQLATLADDAGTGNGIVLIKLPPS
ncbi:PD40 domain-containing protein [Sphingomonas crusticola]|uniref:PD40 domain-containing protein n=1 Tax=Sphingomonas crusticola TaxID=1697973 RepID=UPI000E22EEA9|nr:PD40 domain-containing protein [Sphingomonas crusticola]